MNKKQKNKTKRSPSQGTYTVFLGLQFISKKKKYYKRKDVVEVVKEAVNLAQRKVRRIYPKIRLRLKHKLTKLGKPVNAQIVRLVKSASAAVFEVSERNPNVYFEMGLAFNKKITEPVILLNKRAAKENVVGSDVKDLLRLDYDDNKLMLLKDEIAIHIKSQVIKKISEFRYDIKRIWSGGISKRRITIICPTLPKEYIPKHALRDSPEFVKFAKYGDPDALVDTLMLLRMFFPNITPRYIASEEISENDYEDDLIIIGGPDFNAVAEEFIKESKCPIQYKKIKDDKDAFIHRPSETIFPLEVKERDRVFQDYGFFARFPNPFNRAKTIVMIGGLGTYGVRGAVKAFGTNPICRKNMKNVIDAISENPFFAVLIPIRASRGHIPYSEIDLKTLCKYPWDHITKK